MQLKNKVALITGGSRGIGRAITLKLADEGADVIINYFRKREPAEKTAEQARSKGVRAQIIKANIGDPEKIDTMFDQVEAEFGKLDILVSNAASGVARPAMELDSKSWDWTMDVNSRAFLLCAQRSAKLMKNGGKMVCISSLGSKLVMPTYTSVGVSKAALESLTRYLAVELSPLGICVNGVSAGAIESDALKMYAGDAPPHMWQKTPAGRMVKQEDVADLVYFLCSREAEMIRGQIVVIDGGLSLTSMGYSASADTIGGNIG